MASVTEGHPTEVRPVAYFTFLVSMEGTVEGPDAGEAADNLGHAIRRASALKDERDRVIGVLHEPDLNLRWWPARPVEIVMIERLRVASRRRKRTT